MTNLIIGGGGGGGGKGGGGETTRAAVESPDSLHSKQYARVIDLLCEGEIEGLVDGLKSIYLNNTPIISSDGSQNFSGYTIDSRTGTQSQTYIAGFPSTEAENGVSTEIKYSTPIVRTISNPNTNAVRVTIGIPYLTYQNTTTGDLSGTSVRIAIDVNTNSGGWVQYLTSTISGKTTSRYQRSYRVELTTSGPWDIRIRKLTSDSTISNLKNNIYWESYTEIIDSKLRYPNSALVALSIDSSQFNSIPTRGYDIKGLKVQIPDNYNPITREYTGTWYGTFNYAWTDNPAWCFYDLIVNSRYGLGKFINADQIDKWALYTIGQYCDELVSDGFGGLEPRFTCNLYLQSREEAYKVVNSMASIFRGMVYWAEGLIVPVQDAPTSPSAIFTAANVIGGQFNYEGSSAKARHTVALVTWNDPSDMYRQKIEYVEDIEGISRYGIVQTDLLAVGCTSRGQAHRLGRWLLYTERLESETVTFRTGLEGLVVTPGSIIKTTDSTRSGERRGGRIVSIDGNNITIDDTITITSGKIYTLWVVLPNGLLESKNITNFPGSTNILSLVSSLSDTPLINSMWMLSSSDLIPETWRIVSIVEAEANIAEITALSYREDKYAAVENDLILEPIPISLIDPFRDPDPVTDINILENLYLITTSVVGAKVTLSWHGNTPFYQVKWRKENENWQVKDNITTNSIDIFPIEAGIYEFSITAINVIGKKSTANTFTSTIYGLLQKPKDVNNLSLNAISNQAHLSWDPSTDLDVIVSGSLRIRFTEELISPEWQNAIDIGPKLSGVSTNTVLPLLNGTYMAKWVDSSGKESDNATWISTDASSIINMNFISLLEEQPTFEGTHVGTGTYSGYLSLDSSTTIDDMTSSIDDWPTLNSLGGIASNGTYYFSNSIDLGSVQLSRLTAGIVSSSYDTVDLVDDRSDIDSWFLVDGDIVSDTGCIIYLRTTDDDPTSSPTWSSWKQFVVGDYTARAYEFKVYLYSEYTTHNIILSQLYVSIDMPDKVQSDIDIVTSTTTYSVVYSSNFMTIPAIGITAQNMATGDYYVISNKSVSGFDITFKNSSGTDISRTFDYIARGY